jgi:signal transduction histidine kinase
MSVFSLTTLACISAVTIASIEKIKQGFKPAYFYLFALSFLFIGGINYFLNLFGIVTNLVNQLNGVQVGVVIETVTISFGLLYRYNLFKKENEKLALELEVNKTQNTVQLIAVQEAERKRIAEDLHDDLGGNLATIKMNIQNLPLDNGQLQSIIYLLDKASDDVRSISHNLMPPEFNETNLKDLWVSRYNHLNNIGTIRFNFHSSGTEKRFDKIDELMIYRIISELTNNILKHSHATEATIQLIYYDTYLEIMAEDNGRGMSQKDSDGIGLKNINSRVAFLGGKLDIHSNSFGTTVIVNIDYKH